MLVQLFHNKYLRFVTALFGVLLSAAACNLIIVPLCLYTGGLFGVCQIIRTVLAEQLGLSLPFDLAGPLYLLVNIPLLFLAWNNLGRHFVTRLIVCTVLFSVFQSLIPIPYQPIISDPLTGCLVGGILSGFANGLILTCGCSTGGLDILGLYLSKRGSNFTVGKFSIVFNAALYAVCAILFSLNTAIYSAIYTVFCSLFLDRLHQQNITVQMLIFTKDHADDISTFIMNRLSRGVTRWNGVGSYTKEGLSVLCVCLNKYEVTSLQQMINDVDPHAFVIVQEGVHTNGNFAHHLL